jgi:hypothetical protein
MLLEDVHGREALDERVIGDSVVEGDAVSPRAVLEARSETELGAEAAGDGVLTLHGEARVEEVEDGESDTVGEVESTPLCDDDVVVVADADFQRDGLPGPEKDCEALAVVHWEATPERVSVPESVMVADAGGDNDPSALKDVVPDALALSDGDGEEEAEPDEEREARGKEVSEGLGEEVLLEDEDGDAREEPEGLIEILVSAEVQEDADGEDEARSVNVRNALLLDDPVIVERTDEEREASADLV